MKLKDILPTHLNKTVEVFLDSGFYEGPLVSVSDSSIVVQTTPGYYGPSVELNIVLANVQQLRVINP